MMACDWGMESEMRFKRGFIYTDQEDLSREEAQRIFENSFGSHAEYMADFNSYSESVQNVAVSAQQYLPALRMGLGWLGYTGCAAHVATAEKGLKSFTGCAPAPVVPQMAATAFAMFSAEQKKLLALQAARISLVVIFYMLLLPKTDHAEVSEGG